MISKCPTWGDEGGKMIRVKLFAMLREIVKRDELLLEFSSGASPAEIISYLVRRWDIPMPILESCLVAVNGEYAARDACLSPGDELAILPPVSGG